ncbi:hypothetical protein F5148DRAFT_1180120, partial [Russula earlei]
MRISAIFYLFCLVVGVAPLVAMPSGSSEHEPFEGLAKRPPSPVPGPKPGPVPPPRPGPHPGQPRSPRSPFSPVRFNKMGDHNLFKGVAV